MRESHKHAIDGAVVVSIERTNDPKNATPLKLTPKPGNSPPLLLHSIAEGWLKCEGDGMGWIDGWFGWLHASNGLWLVLSRHLSEFSRRSDYGILVDGETSTIVCSTSTDKRQLNSLCKSTHTDWLPFFMVQSLSLVWLSWFILFPFLFSFHHELFQREKTVGGVTILLLLYPLSLLFSFCFLAWMAWVSWWELLSKKSVRSFISFQPLLFLLPLLFSLLAQFAIQCCLGSRGYSTIVAVWICFQYTRVRT